MRRGDQGSQPGIRADDVRAVEVDVQDPVDRGQKLVDLGMTGRRSIDRPVIRGIGRADEPEVRPGDEEHDLAWHADREPDVARDPLATDDEMGAARRLQPRPAARQRRRVCRPHPGGVDDDPRADLEVAAIELVVDARAANATALLQEPRRTRPGDDPRAVRPSRPGDGQRVAGVVFHPVMEQEAATEPLAPHPRGVGEDLVDREMAVPTAVVSRAEQVVQGHPGLVEDAGHQGPAEQGEEQRLDRDQVRSEVEHPRALAERLAHQPEPVLLEVAQAAVDEPRRSRRRPDRDVVALHEPDPQPARRGVEGGAAPHDPAADDEDVEGPVGEGRQLAPALLERRGGHRRARSEGLIARRCRGA